MITIGNILLIVLAVCFVCIVLIVMIVFYDEYASSKNCLHSCKICKYKEECDWYLRKKNPK